MKQERSKGALAQLVSYMQEGYTWQAAAALAGVHVSQSTAYRLYKAVRERGEVALQDGRHGHPSKLRGAARTFLEDACRGAPQIPSSVIQRILHERFALGVSVSQINRARVALGVSNRPQYQEQGKKPR
jgi:transposase